MMQPSSALWGPFANMADVDGNRVVFERGEGVHVWDTDGKRYLDGSASLWYVNVGHGRREILEAITAQYAKLPAYHVFGDAANPVAIELADRLSALSPQPGSKVFLASGGADAIDTSAKLARLWHATRGEGTRTYLISRERGYHGTHGISTSLVGLPYREGFGTLVEDTSQIPWNDADALEAEILRLGPENVAAFVFEPVIGAGGVLAPPDGYLDRITAICARHGVLTIADGVINGFGRIGAWFGADRFGLAPDLIAFAKGVTSGYLPLGGVVVSPRVAEPFWTGTGRAFLHGATYSGHPACCAAALANISLLEQDGLVHRARELEGWFHSRLREVESHPLVAEVRGGIGFMAAIAIDPERIAADPKLTLRLWRAARTHGLLTRWVPGGIALAPPLIVEDAHLDEALEALTAALNAVA
ncbi:MAG: aspartate aminotransferase family protein [Thermoleophilia bacterium]|nr:aspartate aminotransferase family protein [Thermoleophilia bacterium]